MFKLGPICSVTALHPQFHQSNAGKSIVKYWGYNCKIPTLSPLTASHFVCNQTQQRLYKLIGKQISYLDFSGNDFFGWNVWKHDTKEINTGASICMVDNDRFLVIMNAGAYGSSMSSNYNIRPLAAELLIDKDRVEIIRNKQCH